MYSDPLAYFLTWTCYGTWLPGDERGWTKWHRGEHLPQPLLEDWCRKKMTEEPLYLDALQRKLVEEVVAEHCRVRHWQLHAVNCRSNHCHVVVTAADFDGQVVRDQLKAWCTRRLKEQQQAAGIAAAKLRKNWWTRNGSVRYLFDLDSLEAASRYTREAQDEGGSKLH